MFRKWVLMNLKIISYTKGACNIVLQFPLHLIYFLSGFSPRDNKVWLFGCWGGIKFRGNSKTLFLYVQNSFPEIQSVWITKNKDIYSELREKQINVRMAYSIKGILLTLRAKYVFVTHGSLDVNQFFKRHAVMINLSHSIYPIKDMRQIPESLSLFRKLYLYLSQPYGYLIKPDFAITSSKFTVNATKHHYNIREVRIIPTGTPKTDFLVSLVKESLNALSEATSDGSCARNRKLILFLPTIRFEREFSFFNYGFDVDKLNELLMEINCNFVFHFHPSQTKYQNIPDFINHDYINVLNYSGDQINTLLCNADLLITDYSSLFADFLIFDRPIIFVKFNHEEYVKIKGLFVDYDNDLPGPKVEDWPELLNEIKTTLNNENDKYYIRRNELRDLIYPTLDGNSCERICRFVKSLMK